MLSKDSDSVQAIQVLFGRTHLGRVLSEKGKATAKAWRESRGAEYGKKECMVCGFILASNYFIHGCPNCGSTDEKPVEGQGE